MTQARLVSLVPLFAAAAMAACAGGAAAQADRQITKIGFVNTERVMREARLPQQLKQSLEAEFQKRDREIAAGKGEDMDRRRRLLAEEMGQRRDEAARQFIEKANSVIKRVAEREGFDVVFIEAAYFDKRIDITDRVIKALDSEK